MIVRKKRNYDATSLLNIEKSTLVPTSTEFSMLKNVTSIRTGINGVLNSSVINTTVNVSNTSESVLYVISNSTDQELFGLSAMPPNDQYDSALNEIMINETAVANTYLTGNDQIPQSFIWGIDNTVI